MGFGRCIVKKKFKCLKSSFIKYYIIIVSFCSFQAPPSNVAVTQQPSSSIIHGSKVTFTGSYSSTPLNVKDIKWQTQNGSGYIDIDINGNVKYNGSSVTGSSPKLIINPVQFIDETSYQLVVSNGVGSASSFFSLSIENGMYNTFFWKLQINLTLGVYEKKKTTRRIKNGVT